MEEKSSTASLSYKRANKVRNKQLFFVLDFRSPQQLQPSPVAVKVNAYHFVESSPPEYNSEKRGECLKCGRLTSIQWRRGPAGAETLCNSCGLRWKNAQKREDKLDNTPSIGTGLKDKKTKDRDFSHPSLLQLLKTQPADRKVETTDAVEHEQHKKDDQNKSILKEQSEDKLSIAFILN